MEQHIPTEQSGQNPGVIDNLRHFDAVVFSRADTPGMSLILREAKLAGVRVIYDIDDNLILLPPSIPAYNAWHHRGSTKITPRLWYLKRNIRLDETVTRASVSDSKKVVEICTQYAQKGMFNIFLAVFFGTLAFAFLEPYFFIGYLISIALFGLFQAIFMANAGGAWDNAKKIVEVDLRQKGTDLHAATVVGDTVGDPFKDTSSVAMNPVIKFTTLFGLLAVEIAVTMTNQNTKTAIGAFFFLVALIFVYRSFYGMRISSEH